MAGCIEHQHAGERAYFHGMAFPAWRLQPRIALFDIELLVRRLGSVVVELGLSIVGVQALGLATLVVVPGVRHVLLDLVGRIEVDFMDPRQVAVQDRATREQECGWIIDARFREVTVGQEVA